MKDIIYKTEDEYKKDITKALAKDFILVPEAEIIWPHPAIKPNRADFIIHPKEHLVRNGFDAENIAIEVKSPICKNKESIKKLLNCISQAQSYALCKYKDSFINFVLIYPKIDLFYEYDLHYKNYDEPQKEYKKDTILLHRMMQRANVGSLTLSNNSYSISFAGSRFYSPKKGRSKIKNLGMVRRIGSKKVILK